MTVKLSKKQALMQKTQELFARSGYDGFTMRSLATECEISLSSIYHYFKDKDVLLKSVFDQVNTDLGIKRSILPETETASEALKQRIRFQFENAEQILFVLRYYLHFRNSFPKQNIGYLGEKAYRHIYEVLSRGVETGEFFVKQSIEEEAKVIAHSINGFVLEYFPETPEKHEYEQLVDSIHDFVVRSITNRAVSTAQ